MKKEIKQNDTSTKEDLKEITELLEHFYR